MPAARVLLTICTLMFIILVISPHVAQAYDAKVGVPVDANRPTNSSLVTVKKGSLESVSIPLLKMGYPDGLRLSGLNTSSTLYIPMDPALRVKTLQLHLRTAPEMPTGEIWIESGTRIIASETLPKTAESDWSIPLTEESPQKGLLPLTLHMALQGTNVCSALIGDWLLVEPTSAVRFATLKNVSVPLINQFLPPYVQRLDIFLPNHLKLQDAQAVLDIADYTVHHYAVPPHIRLQTMGTPLVSQAFTRSIVIGGSTLAVVKMPTASNGSIPVLQLGSHPAETAATIFRLPVGLPAMAVTSARRLGAKINNVAEVSGRKVTLAQLGYPDEQVQGLGGLTATYHLSQSDLGGPVHDLVLRFAGVHTPLVNHASGYLGVRFNNIMIYSQALEGTRYDFYIKVPGGLLKRDNTIKLFFQYTPSEGGCVQGAIPFQGTVSSASYLQFQSGESLPSGFDRFPTVYAKKLPVFLQHLTPNTLAEATSLITALQKTTRVALHPDLLSAPPVAGPLLFIGAQAPSTAPLQLRPFALRNGHGENLLQFTPGSPFATLQAYDQTLALVGPPALRNTLLQTSLQQDGWYALRGDIVIQGISGAPVNLRIIGKGLEIKPLPARPGMLLGEYRYWLFALLGMLIIGFLIWLYPRLVRKSGPSGL